METQMSTTPKSLELSLLPRVNTSFDNCLYWLKRSLFFWRYEDMAFELEDDMMLRLFMEAHKRNMTLDQLITDCFERYIRQYS